jgi:YHS domain-containing protein
MMRQICKQILTIAALLVFAASSQAAGLVTTIVADPLTGVALEGFDAVSYFIEPAPQPGKPEFEADWGGVPWYFASAANRDVFLRYPEVYAPQFGGHCATSLGRGYLSDGKAGLYAVEGMKLYLFYSTANREAFLMSRSATIAAAEGKWPVLAEQLTGPAPAVSAPLDIISSAPAGD